MNLQSIAMICHEANRAYCNSIGDASQVAWADAPEWQRDSAIAGVKFHLDSLANGEVASNSASHDSWMEQKLRDGWKYGPVKDAEKKEHPCIVPYSELPSEQQAKDALFASICDAMFLSFGSSIEV